MVTKPGGGRFAFIDAGEAARRLGIDRVTLDQWIKDGRLRPHRGVGRDVFFRSADVEALYNELHPTSELAAAIAEDERESSGETAPTAPTRKKQDPQMRVYLRLQADAKWYDISEEDILTWFKQLAPDGYERNKRNAQHTVKKLQYLISLIEEGQHRQSQ
jgi:excisionase family DNA binding protein